MRIQSLLEFTEQWLMEIEADRVTLQDLLVIPPFLKQLSKELEHAEHTNVTNVSTRRVLGLLQKLSKDANLRQVVIGNDPKNAPTKVDMTPGEQVGGPRDQQHLAYGFRGKQDRHFNMNARDVELSTAIADSLAHIGYFNTDTGEITTEDRISLILDFISLSGVRNPLELLNTQVFRDTQEKFIEKKVKPLNDPDGRDSTSITTNQIDMNTFIFAMSVANSQARGKKAWENYIDPDIINRAQSSFEVRTNKEEAAENLLHIGFLHRDESSGRLLPNWEAINAFKSKVNDRIGEIIERGAKLRHVAGRMERAGAAGRMSVRERNFVELKNLIQKHVPNELYTAAKKAATSKVKSAFSADGIYPELRNAITQYLQDFEAKDEFDPPDSGMSGFIQKSIEVMALKIVLSKLSSLLDKNAVPVDIRKDLNTLKMNISKHMRRKAQN